MQPREGGCCSSTSIFQVDFCFNTQPRGGGCAVNSCSCPRFGMFQHTAARRRLLVVMLLPVDISTVSTHSRAKAAAVHQPGLYIPDGVSTHSRAKAAAPHYDVDVMGVFVFQHTAARRRLHDIYDPIFCHDRFQHTAARRRLQQMRKN